MTDNFFTDRFNHCPAQALFDYFVPAVCSGHSQARSLVTTPNRELKSWVTLCVFVWWPAFKTVASVSQLSPYCSLNVFPLPWSYVAMELFLFLAFVFMRLFYLQHDSALIWLIPTFDWLLLSSCAFCPCLPKNDLIEVQTWKKKWTVTV